MDLDRDETDHGDQQASTTAGLPERAVRRHHRVRSAQAADIAGIAYSILSVLALVRLSRFPNLSLSDEELTAWFDADTNQASLIGALGAASVSAIAFLWFVAVIRRRVGDREDQFFATVFLGSGVAYVVIWLVGAASYAAPAVALTTLDAAAVTPASASLAGGMGATLILVVAPRLQAVFVFSTSTVILRSGVLPTWLAFAGYACGVVLFVVPLVTQPIGLLFPAWVLIVSLVMLIIRPTNLMIAAPTDVEATGEAPAQ